MISWSRRLAPRPPRPRPLPAARRMLRSPRFDMTQFDALKVDIEATPDNLDGISLASAKREAAFKLDAAINARKEPAKLSA